MNIEHHIDEYSVMIAEGLRGFDRDQFEKIIKVLHTAYNNRKTVYLAGNGGSAAISDHFMCDHQKGISTDTRYLFPKINCLSNNIATLTAYANDIGYDVVFARQLTCHGEPGDVLLVISSSGNSPNIVAAIESARTLGMKVISFTGFSGGKAKEMSDLNIHIPINNYGVVEDCHQIVMHMLAQYFRKNYSVDIDNIKL